MEIISLENPNMKKLFERKSKAVTLRGRGW